MRRKLQKELIEPFPSSEVTSETFLGDSPFWKQASYGALTKSLLVLSYHCLLPTMLHFRPKA